MSIIPISRDQVTVFTAYVGELLLPYAGLVAALGEPQDGDRYKVSTEWTVKYADKVFTVYDWKATELYYGDGRGLTVDEFRKLPSYLWRIGTEYVAPSMVSEFFEELERVAAGKTPLGRH